MSVGLEALIRPLPGPAHSHSHPVTPINPGPCPLARTLSFHPCPARPGPPEPKLYPLHYAALLPHFLDRWPVGRTCLGLLREAMMLLWLAAALQSHPARPVPTRPRRTASSGNAADAGRQRSRIRPGQRLRSRPRPPPPPSARRSAPLACLFRWVGGCSGTGLAGWLAGPCQAGVWWAWLGPVGAKRGGPESHRSHLAATLPSRL